MTVIPNARLPAVRQWGILAFDNPGVACLSYNYPQPEMYFCENRMAKPRVPGSPICTYAIPHFVRNDTGPMWVGGKKKVYLKKGNDIWVTSVLPQEKKYVIGKRDHPIQFTFCSAFQAVQRLRCLTPYATWKLHSSF